MITLNRKIRFSHADFTYVGTNYTEFLYGSIGLKVNAEIRINVKWSLEDVAMEFDDTDDTVELTDGSSWITAGFQIGNTVTFQGTASNNISSVITDISSDGATATFTGLSATETAPTASAYGVNSIVAMDFYPNLIANSKAFNLFNLTDRETVPHYYADIITTDAANPTVMQTGSNSKGWVTPFDSATIYKLSSSNFTQVFVISHTFAIAPIFLANQLASLKRGIPPAAGAFKDRDCLKYIYTINAKFTAYDPTIVHTTDGNVDFPDGQTGWFNEFINGRASHWTKESLTYSNASTGAGMSNIDYCVITNINSRIVCQMAAGYYYCVQVLYLPLNEDEYINTATDYKTNFIYERGFVNLSGATAQGENTGDYHFLKNMVATALSANRTQITFQIDFSQTLKDIFDAKDSSNLNYLIFITAQNGSFV